MARRLPIPSHFRHLSSILARSAAAILGAGSLLAAGGSTGQPAPADEPSAESVPEFGIRLFDFEEADSNPLPVPDGWYRAQDDPNLPRLRQGFPLYNAAVLDYDAPARSGEGTLRLPTKGGSTALRLLPGVLPVFTGSDYRVAAYARSDDIEHARFALTAVFLDQRSEPIEASRVRSELLSPGPDWAPVSITLLGKHAEAAYLQVDLELLQPREFEPAFMGEHHVFDEDLDASLFVDDVRVARLPRVELATTSPANIVVEPDPLEFQLLVRDVDSENLSVELEITDSFGDVVSTVSRPVYSTAAPLRFKPQVQESGWYRARASVRSGTRTLGSARTDFLYLPEPDLAEPAGSCSSSPDDRRRFSVAIDGFVAGPNVPAPIDLEELVSRIGLGGFTLGLWSAGGEPNVMDLDRALGETHSTWRDAGFAFDAAPSELIAPGLEPPPAVALLGDARDADSFERAIVPLLDRFGQSIRRWRLGAVDQTGPLFREDYLDLARRSSDRLAKLVPGPRVTAPWAPHFDLESLAGDSPLAGADVLLRPGAGHERLARFAEDWNQRWPNGDGEQPELRYVIPATGADILGPRGAAAELVKRAAEFWRLHVPIDPTTECPKQILELASPLVRTADRRPTLHPTPELAAFRTSIDFLRGRRVIDELELAPDVRCLVLVPADHADTARGGCLVVWSESLAPQTVRLFLGDGDVRLFDIFGNASEPLLPVPWDASDPRADGILVHDLPVSHEPVFVEGIDVELTAFIASFTLEPDFLETGYQAHDASIVFQNPWEGVITGSVSVVSPGGGVGASRDRNWSFNPRVSRFSLAAGNANEVPVEIEFSPVQEAGRVPLVLDVDLVAPGVQRRVRVVAPFEVGLKDIELDVKYVPRPGTSDAVLEAIVSNEGEVTRSLELLANVPGFKRLRASVDDLEPGVSVSRRFTLTNARARLRGDTAYVAAIDRLRGARLNRSVDLR